MKQRHERIGGKLNEFINTCTLFFEESVEESAHTIEDYLSQLPTSFRSLLHTKLEFNRAAWDEANEIIHNLLESALIDEQNTDNPQKLAEKVANGFMDKINDRLKLSLSPEELRAMKSEVSKNIQPQIEELQKAYKNKNFKGGIRDFLAKSASTLALCIGGCAGIAACSLGIIPIVGPMAGGIVGSSLAAIAVGVEGVGRLCESQGRAATRKLVHKMQKSVEDNLSITKDKTGHKAKLKAKLQEERQL